MLAAQATFHLLSTLLMVYISNQWGLLQTCASSEKCNTKSQVGIYQRKVQILLFLRKKCF